MSQQSTDFSIDLTGSGLKPTAAKFELPTELFDLALEALEQGPPPALARHIVEVIANPRLSRPRDGGRERTPGKCCKPTSPPGPSPARASAPRDIAGDGTPAAAVAPSPRTPVDGVPALGAAGGPPASLRAARPSGRPGPTAPVGLASFSAAAGGVRRLRDVGPVGGLGLGVAPLAGRASRDRVGSRIDVVSRASRDRIGFRLGVVSRLLVIGLGREKEGGKVVVVRSPAPACALDRASSLEFSVAEPAVR